MSAAAQAAPPRSASFPRLRALLAWLAERPALIYAGLAVAVAGPLLGRGLVLSVDLAQTPHSPLPSAYWGLASGTNEGSLGRLPFDSLFSLAGSLGVVELTQKLLLLSIPFLAGLGMHKLVDARGTAARLFAGTLYAVNPFVYDRLVSGQWLLLLGYALLPWCFAAFLAVLRGERGALWRFAVLTGVAGAASAHMAGLLALLCLLTVATAKPGHRRHAGIALALAGAASLLWLIPTPGLRDLWLHVGRAQLDLYATRPDHVWGPVVTVLGMHGFWNETSSAATAFALWPAVPALLLLLAARGFALVRDRRVALAVALAGLLGTLLALGMATSVTRPATVYLMDHVSPLRSFRDTQKGLALLVFAYAFLGAPAVEELVRAPRRRFVAAALATAAVAVPLIAGANELGGAGGTLHAASFPSSWQAADDILARDAKSSRTLFLPFHGYLHLSFAHSRVTYNPAPGFFSTPILSSRSVSTDPAVDDVSDAQEQTVQALLADPTAPRLAPCLAALGVSHVLLAHEADWQSVAPIASRGDMRVVARWPDLTLLALRHPGAAAMTAPQGASGACPAGLQPVPSRRLSPTHLRLTGSVPAGRRLILGVPQPQRWTRSGADVTFGGWPAYRRVYVAGLIGWLIVLVGAGIALAQRRRS